MRKMYSEKQIKEIAKYPEISSLESPLKGIKVEGIIQTNDLKIYDDNFQEVIGYFDNGEQALLINAIGNLGENYPATNMINFSESNIIINGYKGGVSIISDNINIQDKNDDNSIRINSATGVEVYIANGFFTLSGTIPTSDPHVADALWNDNGTLKISAGV